MTLSDLQTTGLRSDPGLVTLESKLDTLDPRDELSEVLRACFGGDLVAGHYFTTIPPASHQIVCLGEMHKIA